MYCQKQYIGTVSLMEHYMADPCWVRRKETEGMTYEKLLEEVKRNIADTKYLRDKLIEMRKRNVNESLMTQVEIVKKLVFLDGEVLTHYLENKKELEELIKKERNKKAESDESSCSEED